MNPKTVPEANSRNVEEINISPKRKRNNKRIKKNLYKTL